ncbi:unnamed protein product [Ranitomeya imitator]|uniref:Uncharacterized protein n=1 Tax=Ranitomeya imitator TaxID=111125 RepID=A0ABN9MII4_9NEOB|nr:unnamed protein product [Ranitomeya imitator]
MAQQDPDRCCLSNTTISLARTLQRHGSLAISFSVKSEASWRREIKVILMPICRKPSGKTVPDKEGMDAATEPLQHSRGNGWSWPAHPLQFMGWFTYLLYTIIGFGILKY